MSSLQLATRTIGMMVVSTIASISLLSLSCEAMKALTPEAQTLVMNPVGLSVLLFVTSFASVGDMGVALLYSIACTLGLSYAFVREPEVAEKFFAPKVIKRVRRVFVRTQEHPSPDEDAGASDFDPRRSFLDRVYPPSDE